MFLAARMRRIGRAMVDAAFVCEDCDDFEAAIDAEEDPPSVWMTENLVRLWLVTLASMCEDVVEALCW